MSHVSAKVRVWDPVVRLTHWAVAALLLTEWLNEAGANPWHRYLGYSAGALVCVRLIWGVIGPVHTRLASIATRASQSMTYLRDARLLGAYVGHTPPGAVMALTLWLLTLWIVLTGWMLQLDAFWGNEVLQTVHVASAYVMAACALMHVIAALVTSYLTRTNLIRAMLTGNTPAGSRSAAPATLVSSHEQ